MNSKKNAIVKSCITIAWNNSFERKFVTLLKACKKEFTGMTVKDGISKEEAYDLIKQIIKRYAKYVQSYDEEPSYLIKEKTIKKCIKAVFASFEEKFRSLLYAFQLEVNIMAVKHDVYEDDICLFVLELPVHNNFDPVKILDMEYSNIDPLFVFSMLYNPYVDGKRRSPSVLQQVKIWKMEMGI